MSTRLTRRSALTLTAAGALAAPAIAQGAKVARLVTTWGNTTPGHMECARRIADRINRMAEGSLTVEVYASGEIVPAFDTLETVAAGEEAEMLHAPSGYWRNEHPGFQFFNTVPNGFTCEENAAWIQYGGGGALWEELFARYNIKAFIGGGSGVQAGGWFSKEINSLSDMAGLRMRIAGYGGEVLARVGGTPVSLPADKLVTELYSGALDAAEWNGPYADLDFGFAKLLPYYVQPGFHEPGATEFIGVNQQFWQGLTTRERAIVEYASRAEAAFTLGQFRAENGRALKQLVTEYGARVWAMPQDVWLQAARMSEEIVAEKADVDDLGRRIYRSYIRFRAEIAPWSSTSLEAYALARQRAFSAT